ncbi:MAG: GyrI-like domain-containing protein [Ignavibacteria bacterium]|nr:GyrI-like domain-containing protein [Ignavibacteria bacterium]
MEKLDLKKQFKHLYNPSAKDVSVVDVPSMAFLMIDGQGDPNTSPEYALAIETLYAVSYTLKFAVKKSGDADYTVGPLEGLWWVDDMRRFSIAEKGAWKWTAMIAQPDFITPVLVEHAQAEVMEKKGSLAMPILRFETFTEGTAAQILHIGPYSTEGPTIERLHAHIAHLGAARTGKHHEIYLGDPRRTAPEKLKTVIRQPFRMGK